MGGSVGWALDSWFCWDFMSSTAMSGSVLAGGACLGFSLSPSRCAPPPTHTLSPSLSKDKSINLKKYVRIWIKVWEEKMWLNDWSLKSAKISKTNEARVGMVGSWPGSLSGHVAGNVFIWDSYLWSECLWNQKLKSGSYITEKKKSLPGLTWVQRIGGAFYTCYPPTLTCLKKESQSVETECVLPKFICWNLISIVMVLWGGAFGGD